MSTSCARAAPAQLRRGSARGSSGACRWQSALTRGAAGLHLELAQAPPRLCGLHNGLFEMRGASLMLLADERCKPALCLDDRVIKRLQCKAQDRLPTKCS